MGLWQVLKSQFLCHLFICYVFLVSGLIINAVQICTLPLWLLDKQLARRINVRLGYCVSSRKLAPPSVCSQWMCSMNDLQKTRLFLTVLRDGGCSGVVVWD